MKTAILTIGTEILFGQVVNTNAAFLSEQLQNIGYDVMYHYTVGDNPGRLEKLLGIAFEDCDLVLTTGGLGPTQDDVTKETICRYFGDEMVKHPEVEEWLRDLWKKMGMTWTDNNLTQAYFPSTAELLPNPKGTAPGFRLEKNRKIIMSMPGPPREMKAMFLDYVKPYLESRTDGHICYKIVRTYGIGESVLEDALLPLIDGQTDPTIATYCKEGECMARVTSKRETLEEAEAAVEEMVGTVKSLVGDYVFSCDNEELVEVLGKILIEKNITISAAESCTAGLFASTLCSVPGISAVFDRGLVTYSEVAKKKELGVRTETLEKYTAVSPEVAFEMVSGLAAKTGSALCLSITGVAGPDDLSEDKPAGLAYIGLRYKGEVKVVEFRTRNVDRNNNRRKMVLRMISEAYSLVK
ncbi:MAG: competence/damage-inducible protein A [Lachnospiraceae bacterium]|nr:competence/damage-inducible protein A [Lachnospiraceae bacterium]